jgi:hypothetical protein
MTGKGDDLVAGPRHEQLQITPEAPTCRRRLRKQVAEFGHELRLRGMVKTSWTPRPADDLDTGSQELRVCELRPVDAISTGQ